MAETSVILFELLHGWNRVNIDYITMNIIMANYIILLFEGIGSTLEQP